MKTIIKMAEILNTSTDYLLDLTDNPNPADFTLSEKESILINNYRELSKDEQTRIESYIQAYIDLKKI